MSHAKRKPHLRVVSPDASPDQIDPVGQVQGRDLASKYQVIFEQSSDAIMTLTLSGKIDEVNRAFEDLSGYLKTEIEGARSESLAPTEKTHIPARCRPISREMFRSPGMYEDVVIMRKDGFTTLVDLNVRHVTGGHSMLVLALFRDVSEKKKLERELITKHSELKNAYVDLEKAHLEAKSAQESLVQAGKMAALGELSAGIAHELNQPLQGIRGYAQEVQSLLPTPPEPVGFALREIISNVDKMSEIISYLRAFTRKSTENHESVSIHQVIEAALRLLGKQFQSRGIRVERNFSKEDPRVYANPLQLEQVFINLATNARDAIEETGRGRGTIKIETRMDHDFVEVYFEDDGAGMAEKTRSKMFNPFFTTKEVGKGMGLGLSISYGILNKIHGSILVESKLGSGTRFKIRIPEDYRETV